MTRQDDPGADGRWDERTLLLTMLRYVQETAVFKVQGLDEETAQHAPVATSPLTTPAALLNHLRWVERSWVNADLLGGEDDGPWSKEDPDAELRQGHELPLTEVIRLYEEEAARTRAAFRADRSRHDDARRPQGTRQPHGPLDPAAPDRGDGPPQRPPRPAA